MVESNLELFLRERGIVPSYQRIEVLEFINQCLAEHLHPSSDEIYSKLKEKNKMISKATVYNTLKLFEKNKIIKLINYDGKLNRYELNEKPHGHFVCRECGRIFDIDLKDDFFKPEDFNLQGFSIDSYELVINGLCKDCMEKGESKVGY